MKVSQAVNLWLEYHRLHSKKTTTKANEAIILKLAQDFGDRPLDSLTPDEVLSFLNHITHSRKPMTKRTRFSYVKAFFNFCRDNFELDFRNPCDTPMFRKLFRVRTTVHWDILDKESIDEIIFKIPKHRNRLMIYLMARGGTRVSEVLKLTPADIEDQRLLPEEPKSGKEHEVVFLPQKLAYRLKGYIRDEDIGLDQPIFPVTYSGARAIVRKAGAKVGIKLRCHDLRRHAATYASRSGVPIEIVSKIILRHSHLATTQRYLGTVSDAEAPRWIECVRHVALTPSRVEKIVVHAKC